MVAALILGILIGAVGNGTTEPSTIADRSATAPRTVTATATRTVTTTATVTPSKAPAAAPATSTSAAPTSSAARAPATSFGEGQYQVGVDIVPGQYKSPGPDDGRLDFCYVEREKDASGDFDSIIANEVVTGPQSITVKKGEFVKNQGCRPFVKVG